MTIGLSEKEEKWMESVIKEEQITRYLENGRDFIDDEEIWEKLKKNQNPDKQRIREIIQKSLEIETLEPDETAESCQEFCV